MPNMSSFKRIRSLPNCTTQNLTKKPRLEKLNCKKLLTFFHFSNFKPVPFFKKSKLFLSKHSNSFNPYKLRKSFKQLFEPRFAFQHMLSLLPQILSFTTKSPLNTPKIALTLKAAKSDSSKLLSSIIN